MSDLIDRQNAIDVLEILADKMSDAGQTVMAQAVAVLKYLHPAESERTAKVETVEKPNVYKCSECGQYFHSTAWGSPVKYCSRCGCRLNWDEDIPMEYFENGGI